MQLEQVLGMYHPAQMQKAAQERKGVYTTRDLEFLSAGALYTPKIGGIGSNHCFTWLSNPQPRPDLEIRTPNVCRIAGVEGVIPTSESSLLYFNLRGQILGGIENLDSSEMSVLLKKHFGR